MGAISKSLLVAVAAILGLCAVAGFTMGLTSTFAHRASVSPDEEAPIAANIAPGVTIKDAQPLAPPPPPPSAPPKPKSAASDAAAALDQPPAEAPAAKSPAAPPTESAPGAPPSLAVPPPPKAPAPLPADLPPV
jgi:hypothetical protein